jgi:hypothetical protein
MAQQTPINRSKSHKLTLDEAREIAESLVNFVDTVIVVLESDPQHHPTAVGVQRRKANEAKNVALDDLSDALVATRVPRQPVKAREIAEQVAEGDYDMADAMFDGLQDLVKRARAAHLLAELADYKYAESHGLRGTQAEPSRRGLFRRRRS